MKIITLAILVLLLAGMTDARMPQKGDQINAIVSSGATTMLYVGSVEDIGNGLICMNCTAAGVVGWTPNTEPQEICLGIGNIIKISW